MQVQNQAYQDFHLSLLIALKSNFGIFPVFEISIFSFSSFPAGTSGCGMLGIFDKILSKSNLIFFCFSFIFSIEDEITFDFANSDLSFDLDISFFLFLKIFFE